MDYTDCAVAAMGVIAFGVLLITFFCDALYSVVGKIFVLLGFVLVILGFIFLGKTIGDYNIKQIKEKAEQRQQREEEVLKATEDADNGYEIYLYGQKVSLDDINIEKYDITFEDDEEKIILD